MIREKISDLGTLEGSVLVFGGPYSNLQATQAMRDIAGELNIPAENVICTGDIVAYCADAAATTDLIREWGIHLVMGNCEESLASGALDCGCGFEEDSACSLLSTGWYRYAQKQISSEQAKWMGALPRSIRFSLQGHSFQVVHGGLDQINRFVFAGSDASVFAEEFAKTDADVVIGGHCGIPFSRTEDGKHWLNAGVIGMPANDGTPDGWYMLIMPDPAAGKLNVRWHRLSYQVVEAQGAMDNAGLKTPYRESLASGLWPSMDVLPEAERNACGQQLQLEERVIV